MRMHPGPRRPRARTLGPLAIALALHGVGLVLAASFGFRIPERLAELPETFVLSLSNRPALAEEVEVAAEAGAEASDESDPWLELAVLEAVRELTVLQAEPEPELVVLEPDPPEPAEPAVEVAEAAASLTAAAGDAPATAIPGTPSVGPGMGALAFGPRHPRAGTFVPDDGAAHGVPVPIGPTPGKNGAGGEAGGTGTGSARRAVVVREPKAITTPPPPYPQLSRRAGEEGSVLCKLHISAAGGVSGVEVVESSGFGRLDTAARETLVKWRFEPLLVDGHGVATTVLHRVTFRLES